MNMVKGELAMNNILDRDRTGNCEGECNDLVRAGEEERQAQINADPFKSPESYPNTPWAHSRNEQPGVYGGHV
jgi:hypothetical protein